MKKTKITLVMTYELDVEYSRKDALQDAEEQLVQGRLIYGGTSVGGNGTYTIKLISTKGEIKK